MSYSRPHTTDAEQHHDRTRQEQTFGDVMHGTPTILIEYLIRSMQEQEKRLAEIMSLAQATRDDNVAIRAENADLRARLVVLQEQNTRCNGPVLTNNMQRHC